LYVKVKIHHITFHKAKVLQDFWENLKEYNFKLKVWSFWCEERLNILSVSMEQSIPSTAAERRQRLHLLGVHHHWIWCYWVKQSRPLREFKEYNFKLKVWSFWHKERRNILSVSMEQSIYGLPDHHYILIFFSIFLSRRTSRRTYYMKPETKIPTSKKKKFYVHHRAIKT
jgi:hypothetical protein